MAEGSSASGTSAGAAESGGGHYRVLVVSAEFAGRSLLEHAIERARPQGRALVINANGDPDRFAGFELSIVADPVEALNPVFDLGVCVSRELLERGFRVDYLDLLSVDAGQDTEEYLSSLPVRQIRITGSSLPISWVKVFRKAGFCRPLASNRVSLILGDTVPVSFHSSAVRIS